MTAAEHAAQLQALDRLHTAIARTMPYVDGSKAAILEGWEEWIMDMRQDAAQGK